MKNEKNPLRITEISWEDFQKLDLKGFRHRRYFYKGSEEKKINPNDIGEFVTDSNGGKHWVQFADVFTKVDWERINLNDIVKENIELSKKERWTGAICLALHKEEDCEIDDYYFENSYLDKWLTREGNQSYLIRCDVEHLYSRRNYFYTKDDYFDIPKNETRAVYLIYWN